MARLICTVFGLTTMLMMTSNAFADPVDSLIHDEMQKHQIAGLALNISRDGQPIKTECYGKANLEWDTPVAKDTVFEIGSITKQFTAACILMLVQEGKLSLDDNINDHLKIAPTNWANIKVRHLLSHTSGIRNYTVIDGFELRQHLTQEQFIKLLADLPLEFQPGDSWHYCNSGFNLLGYIVENVSGQKYWDFIQQRIFTPVGMNSTTKRDPIALIPHRAAGYEMKNHQPINRDYDLTDLFAAGAIVSTIVDMSKWDAALNGETLLNKASKESWWTPTTLNTGKVQNYGFGWFIDSVKDHKNIGHGGATSGFSASIQRFPDDHFSVIVLCNADELDVATMIAKKVAGVYFDRPVAVK
jgi:CubicO group peptidase (beta-lactamase class C family)